MKNRYFKPLPLSGQIVIGKSHDSSRDHLSKQQSKQHLLVTTCAYWLTRLQLEKSDIIITNPKPKPLTVPITPTTAKITAKKNASG